MKYSGFKFGLLAVLCVLLSVSVASAALVPLENFKTVSASTGDVTLVSSSANDNYPISVDQAKNSIRLFVGNLAIDPTLYGTGSMPIGNYYYFTYNKSIFYVNQNSGIVEFAYFPDIAADSDVVNFNRDQAYAKATEYAEKKYDGFSSVTWDLITDKLNENTYWRFNETSKQSEKYIVKVYEFTLREKKSRVLTPNLIHVHINPATGMVSEWTGVSRMITVSLTPTTSLSNATKVAEEYYSGYINIDRIDSYLAVVIRSQNVENLVWVVTVKGTYKGNSQYEESEMAIVDAQTGSIIGRSWDDIWPERSYR